MATSRAQLSPVAPPIPVRSLQRLRQALPPDLRGQLRSARELASHSDLSASVPPFPTALPAVDRLLAGGLPRGQLIELRGRHSSGRFSFVLALLAAATSAGEVAALIDLGDHFDPQCGAGFGIALERLLWVRPRHLKEALAAAEMVAGSALPLVVLDLGLPPVAGGRGAEAHWVRLARAVRQHRTAMLVSAPYRTSGSAAAGVLELHLQGARWHGMGASPRLLLGLTCQCGLEKSPNRQRGSVEVELCWWERKELETPPTPTPHQSPAATDLRLSARIASA